MEVQGGQAGQGNRPRLWTPVFVAVLFVALCCFTVGQDINSGTSVYIGRLGGTASLAGMGAAIFSVAAAVARIVSGPLIDTRGRGIVMGAGMALWGVTNDAFGFSFTIGCIIALIVVSFCVALLTYPVSEKR